MQGDIFCKWSTKFECLSGALKLHNYYISATVSKQNKMLENIRNLTGWEGVNYITIKVA